MPSSALSKTCLKKNAEILQQRTTKYYKNLKQNINLNHYSHIATRETGYIYSSTSAAIMHTISRGCMEGKLGAHCSCSAEDRPGTLHSKHVWGGCGDNLPYGYQFSKLFTSAGEQLSDGSVSGFSRVLMNLHNNEAGRWVSFICFICITDSLEVEFTLKRNFLIYSFYGYRTFSNKDT